MEMFWVFISLLVLAGVTLLAAVAFLFSKRAIAGTTPRGISPYVMETLLRWVRISLLGLASATVLAIMVLWFLAPVMAEREQRGASPSEWSGPYFPLIWLSGIVGLLALEATGLFWVLGLSWMPSLRNHPRRDFVLKLSLVALPLGSFIMWGLLIGILLVEPSLRK